MSGYRRELANRSVADRQHGRWHGGSEPCSAEAGGLSTPEQSCARAREIGCVERTLFIFDWLSDLDLQGQAQMGSNRGEAHSALKRAIRLTDAAKFATEPPRDNITGSLASICSPPSSSIGTPGGSARSSSRWLTPVRRRRQTFSLAARLGAHHSGGEYRWPT